MVWRVILRLTLSVLIAAVQVAGTLVSGGSATSPETARYFCCCVGECACSGDCCNHAPKRTEERAARKQRWATGAVTLNAPLECGIWRATLQRCNDRGQKLLGADSGRTIAPSKRSQWWRAQLATAEPRTDGYQPSSPRGPPPIALIV